MPVKTLPPKGSTLQPTPSTSSDPGPLERADSLLSTPTPGIAGPPSKSYNFRHSIPCSPTARSQAMSELVSRTTSGPVGVITVQNPPVNALSPGVPEGIRDALEAFQ